LKHNFRQSVSVVHGGRSVGGATAAFQRQAGGGRGCVGMRFDFRVARDLKKYFLKKKKRYEELKILPSVYGLKTRTKVVVTR
jgi:hypothetical protein